MCRSGPSAPVIVIGAGIVGVSTAAFLARANVPVRLLEAKAPASGATGAADGAVSVASKRPGPMMGIAWAGLRFYRDLVAEGILDGVFHERPTFLAASNQAEAELLARHADALRAEGIALTWHDAGHARRRLPALAASTQALLEVQGEGHAVGFRVVDRLIASCRLVVERNRPIAALVRDASGNRVVGVQAGDEILPASSVVVAAGNDTARLVGFPDAARPRKGQQLVTERAPALAAALPGSIISAAYLLSKGAQAGQRDERGYGVVIDLQETGQFLIGSTREDGLTDTANDLEAVAHMAQAAATILPELARLRVIRCFAGVRTAVADGLPMIGPMPGCSNLFVASGFEGDGICLGPLTGSIVAGLVRGIAAPIDLAPFDPARLMVTKVAA